MEGHSRVHAERKAAEDQLEIDLDAKYSQLGEDEVKELVVGEKWLAAIDAAIHGELDRVSQTLAARVKELAERYATPLSNLGGRVAELEAKVVGHLERMGVTWK